jgi:glycosyltransferase involved in cell wall biosynthesis
MNLLVFNIRTDADHPTQYITTRWLKQFSRQYGRIYVIAIHAGRLDLPANVTVYALKRAGIGRLGMILRFYRLLGTLLRKGRIRAVFVHQAVLLGAMAGPLLVLKRIPVVMWRSHKSRTLTLRLCHLFSNVVISSSKDAFSLSSRKLVVTGHGIDTNAFSPGERGKRDEKAPFLIGHIGRYSPVKRIEVLLRTVSRLTTGGCDNVRVLLFGLTQNPMEERYYRDIEGLRRTLKLEEKVVFHGPVNNEQMPALLNGLDLLVSQQRTGGTDKAVLEAMSCGLPVLMATTTFNGLLEPGLVDLLVFASGSYSEMVEKLLRLMNMNDGERADIGLRLRSMVLENHSLDGFSRHLKEIFETLNRKRSVMK